ncbi:hypothetical protein QEM42_003891 [Pseudomonas putida]|uniref:hypothetical protein n=1 Tax=Pseudomonas TaxID=286 RepID=UPI001198B3CE|nr:hypothetical protein [Pseudomonas putida]EKT4562690.1 hypothetical protein [Pseudomonas putida]MDP9538270.1 hypothetical protein [Pseudomonas putida]QDY39907.1 hypothetical protein CHR26_28070 [Pseudomonas putida]
MKTGFREAQRAVIAALESGEYQHVSRGDIDIKNLLATGEVSAREVVEVVRYCRGIHHASSPHHAVAAVEVHVLKRDGWYIKFFFIEPDTWFISVHQ